MRVTVFVLVVWLREHTCRQGRERWSAVDGCCSCRPELLSIDLAALTAFFRRPAGEKLTILFWNRSSINLNFIASTICLTDCWTRWDWPLGPAADENVVASVHPTVICRPSPKVAIIRSMIHDFAVVFWTPGADRIHRNRVFAVHGYKIININKYKWVKFWPMV